MKPVAKSDEDLVVEIPLIVGVGIVGVQPQAVVVPLDVEHVRPVVGVGLSYKAPSMPLLIE